MYIIIVMEKYEVRGTYNMTGCMMEKIIEEAK